ncbi:MAG: NAD(P)-binding protein, partial [bacterium]
MSDHNLNITRRDFLNAVLIGTGALLLELPAPARLLAQTQSWKDYGGVGDYAASHGNTEEIVRISKKIQQGKYNRPPDSVIDTEEIFDLLVVGGGLSGLSAAFQFRKDARNGQKCLIIENHPIFGGHAKRNEFMVNGYLLTGPQASNAFVFANRGGTRRDEIFADLRIPRTFSYQELSPELDRLTFDRTSYGFMLWQDISASVGFFFDQGESPYWVIDPWGRKLKKAPYSRKVKRDFFTWRNSEKKYYRRADFQQWLDSITYSEYLEKVMGLSPEIPKFANPIIASALGLGSDAISAYGAYQIGMPGFKGFGRWPGTRRLDETNWHSFPGGNDGFTRYFIKALIPGAIDGEYSFNDILNRPVNLSALDSPANDVRMRLGATVVGVEHVPSPGNSDHVLVTYVKKGQTYRLKAKAVAMASAGWTTRHIVKDLPDKYKSAYEKFFYSPVLVVNVA